MTIRSQVCQLSGNEESTFNWGSLATKFKQTNRCL